MPPPPPSDRRRRWPLALGATVIVAVCVVAAALWFDNTSDPDFYTQTAIPVGTPGETVAVATTDEGCLGPFITWQRRGLLGRWQQTHYNGIRDVVPWYDLRSREYFSDLSCPLDGARQLQVPDDIDLGLVAACTIDDRCVQVIVTEPIQTVTQPPAAAD
ncbi:MAG: hypothetical protein ACR2QE_02215 [Acidimicrobiales bacterium]